MKCPETKEHKYSIGEAAKLLDVSTDTLRFYERKGLLQYITKTSSGYRRYSKKDIKIIAFIKQAQAHALSLSDIKQILDMKQTDFSSCEAVHILMLNKKEEITKKIESLRSVAKSLDEWIAACEVGGELPINDCPILKSLDEANEQNI